MKHTAIGVAAALVLAGAAMPAHAADKETRQMMADIRMLQEQSQQLQYLLGSLGEALKALNGRIDEQSDVNRKAFADQRVIIETLSNDLRVVRERADDTNVRLGSLSQEVDALHDAMTKLAAAAPAAAVMTGGLPPTGDQPPADPGATTAPATTPTATTPVIVASPQKLYASAQADYSAGLYDLAIAGFQAYIKSFPTSPEADDAQVTIATAYLNDGKYREALEAADLAIRNYPESNALPEAYFRRAMALRGLKQNDRARQAFEEVYKKYPNSPEAQLALQRIGELMKP